MKDELDIRLAALAAEPPDRSLDGLDGAIVRDVAGRRREARALRALAPVRLASLGLALALGVTAGGAVAMATARTPQPVGPFAAGAQLAPSSLLEGVG